MKRVYTQASKSRVWGEGKTLKSCKKLKKKKNPEKHRRTSECVAFPFILTVIIISSVLQTDLIQISFPQSPSTSKQSLRTYSLLRKTIKHTAP